MIVDDETKTRLSEGVPDPLVGRTFDGYRIDGILGRGGMGVVYRATQLSLGREVAIKVLPEEVTENKQFLDRFEREVDILARLSHPNIVTVFERGEVDERPYIAMELVRGTALRDVMRRGPLPPAEALILVRSILSALEHAHGAGIVHRDIKPENVLVAPGGIVKVADFGLSRLLEDDVNTRLTKTHIALGTFEYMSPEQREMSRDADARTDLYATGVVLYEMIAGELPIGGFDPLSLKRPEECDARIDAVVNRSLKKSPDDRWSNAQEMGDAVSRLLSAPEMQRPTSRATPPPPPPPVLDAVEEPGWKKVISNFVGAEYPIARIEKRLPRKFAQRLLEAVDVQRYLGRLVALKPDFPGGVDFRTEGGRLLMKFEGRARLDPFTNKRLIAAFAVVLEANAPAGHCRRIAVADPQFEEDNRALLENPPLVMREARPRPDQIPDQSMLVSDASLASHAHRQGGGSTGKTVFWSLLAFCAAAGVFLSNLASAPIVWFMIFGLGVAAVAIVGAFLYRGQRPKQHHDRSATEARHPDYRIGFGITALWVTIVVVLSKGNWRDEEIAWLCVGAIASVFLIPMIPRLLKSTALVVTLIFGGVLLVCLSALFLTLGVHDEMEDPTTIASPERWPGDAKHLALVKHGGTYSQQAVTGTLNDEGVIGWVDYVVPGTRTYFTGSVSMHQMGNWIAGGREGFWSMDESQRKRVSAALGWVLVQRYPKMFKRLDGASAHTSKVMLDTPIPAKGEKFTPPAPKVEPIADK